MSLLRDAARLSTSFRPSQLPEFEKIAITEIPKASIVVCYGGPAITEVAGNYLYKHIYEPAPFHAAGYLGNGEILNIGKRAEILQLSTMLRSTRRIDVIVLTDLTDEEREIICEKFRRDAGHNFYDVVGFIRFGGKLKALRFLKKLRSSNRNDFCSDNVVDNFSEPPLRRKGETAKDVKSLVLPRRIGVSYKPSEDSAPWDLTEYAYDHPSIRSVKTLHIGSDFKKYTTCNCTLAFC